MTKTGRKNKWRDTDVLNGFKCVAVNHYKVTDTFKCSRGESEREKGLIKQIQHPALLIRLIFQLPGVNYHTHTSRCCSTYIIITVAKMENDLKLILWGLPPPKSRHTRKHASHHNSVAINTLCLKLSVYSQSPFPPQEPAVFGNDFIYLMTAALMTLLTLLMVSQTPHYLRNEAWIRVWGERGAGGSEGSWMKWAGYDRRMRSRWHRARRRSLSFHDKQGHWMQDGN